MAKLGVNIDHVATLRQARGGTEPEPIKAALICEKAGCNSIVAHLREDRRHIKDSDIVTLRKEISTRLNLEMSVNEDIVKAAIAVKPDQATLVPERRQEITTEGGLEVTSNIDRISEVVKRLEGEGIEVSLFIDPDEEQIRASKKTGAHIIEIHTGAYANANDEKDAQRQLAAISHAQKVANELGLLVNAGHGLNYVNVAKVAAIRGIEELNIGHSIISYSVFVGMEKAVKDMIALIR